MNPALIGKPVGVQQKTILATCSYEARAFGVGKVCRDTHAEPSYLCADLHPLDSAPRN